MGKGGNNDIVQWVEKTERKYLQINGNQTQIRKRKIVMQLIKSSKLR